MNPSDTPSTLLPSLDSSTGQEATRMETVDESSRSRFENGWRSGHPEPIENCLPRPDHPCYLATLEELVFIEMEFSWRAFSQQATVAATSIASRPALVESYLKRFPELDNQPCRLRLIRQEVRVRGRFAERPHADEYCQRFPTLVTSDKDLGPNDVPARSGDNRQVAGYEMLGVIGRGGMGIVYKARQYTLNRLVALKMLLPNAGASPSDLQRFRTEVEATAALHHPNIVRVHEFSECDGQPYYSMDFIDGLSLEQRLAGGPLSGKVAARYLAQIARAIHHAHQHGILHRDLKPSNILIDAGDQPHVTDFGIAKQFSAADGPTRTGSILGTPSFMAPEQASGSKKLSPATDVYGLGALLYALLTGRPPFLGETLTDTLMQVLEREPVPPRLLNPKIDRDLETICLKCLEKDPTKRYPSAERLAADLERYLAGDSIDARSINILDRIGRALGRSAADVEFHSWGTFLLLSGIIVFVCHTTNFVAWNLGLPYRVRWITGTVQFTLIGLAFWRNRPGKLLPTSTAERQLWTVWIGYFLASATIAIIDMQLVRRDGTVSILDGTPEANQWSLYPYSALLSGFAFFVLGSSYWGGCYLIGLAFFALAMLMPVRMEYAPIAFAVLWSGSLCTLGTRLRQLGSREFGAVDVATSGQNQIGQKAANS